MASNISKQIIAPALFASVFMGAASNAEAASQLSNDDLYQGRLVHQFCKALPQARSGIVPVDINGTRYTNCMLFLTKLNLSEQDEMVAYDRGQRAKDDKKLSASDRLLRDWRREVLYIRIAEGKLVAYRDAGSLWTKKTEFSQELLGDISTDVENRKRNLPKPRQTEGGQYVLERKGSNPFVIPVASRDEVKKKLVENSNSEDDLSDRCLDSITSDTIIAGIIATVGVAGDCYINACANGWAIVKFMLGGSAVNVFTSCASGILKPYMPKFFGKTPSSYIVPSTNELQYHMRVINPTMTPVK